MTPEQAVKTLSAVVGRPRAKGSDGLFLDNTLADTSANAVAEATVMALDALVASLEVKPVEEVKSVKIVPPVK